MHSSISLTRASVSLRATAVRYALESAGGVDGAAAAFLGNGGGNVVTFRSAAGTSPRHVDSTAGSPVAAALPMIDVEICFVFSSFDTSHCECTQLLKLTAIVHSHSALDTLAHHL